MTTLSPRPRRQAEDVEAAHERNARHILKLVESWGRNDLRTCVPDEDELRLSIDGSTHVRVRSLSDVWARR